MSWGVTNCLTTMLSLIFFLLLCAALSLKTLTAGMNQSTKDSFLSVCSLCLKEGWGVITLFLCFPSTQTDPIPQSHSQVCTLLI